LKKTFLISFIFFAVLRLSAQAVAPDASRDADEEVLRMQVAMKMADLRLSLLNKDSVKLSALLADDVTYGHSNGMLQTKAELIRDVMSGYQDYKKLEVKKIEIRLFGGSAVVNLESLVSLNMAGKPMDLDMDIVLVWVKANGADWKLVARQSVKNS
jgi:ketosteroid isomerase-like protein